MYNLTSHSHTFLQEAGFRHVLRLQGNRPPITPLYPKVPQAAREDAQLYELLALTDALRVGRPRERQLASDLLKEMTRMNHV